MAVGEAITNLAAAPIDLGGVKLSMNWMAACGEDGEDAALYDTVHAVAMQLCPALGISVPVGAGTDATIDALVPLLDEGDIIVDGGNALFTDTIRREAAVRAKGLHFVGAGISGGEEGAIAGKLSIMVGGSDDAFTRSLPMLEGVGSTVVHVGPSGSGQTVKAANQLIVAANIQALAEAIVFLEAHDVDTAAAVKVLGGGLAGSTVLDHKAQRMLDRDFAPGGRIDLHHKDLGIVTAAARDAGVVTPLGSLVATLMASARANGDGGLDHAALFRVVERMSGRFDEAAD